MPKRVRQPCRSQMYTKRISENRQMGLHDIAHDLEIDAEILVHENVSESSNLWPCDFRMLLCNRRGEMVHGLADDLKVPFNGIHRHVRELGIAIQKVKVFFALRDGLDDICDPLLRASTHSATASARASRETGFLRSCAGKISTSSRPRRCRVSSIRPDARINRFPSAGSISTRMSMSLP